MLLSLIELVIFSDQRVSSSLNPKEFESKDTFQAGNLQSATRHETLNSHGCVAPERSF